MLNDELLNDKCWAGKFNIHHFTLINPLDTG
jgi:hypothetical protein